MPRALNLLRVSQYFLILVLSAAPLLSHSQDIPEFNISDTTISVCTGILFDSGGPTGLYGNNENFTFIIQPGGTITLSFFGIFNIEPGLDFLTIYDGPDTNAPLIGTFSGTTAPPILVANSGSVTLVFTSDNSAIYAGFSMLWETEVPPPIPPILSVGVVPACGSYQIPVQFSSSLQCEWLDDAIWNVSLNGLPIQVSSVSPNCSGGETDQVVLHVAQPIDVNCLFQITLDISIPDACDLLYEFELTTEFLETNCEINADIEVESTQICPGDCTSFAVVTQGCLGYSYDWSGQFPPTAGPHQVCPGATSTYTVLVTENETGQILSLSVTIQPSLSSILTTPLTVCQSEPAFHLEAETSGVWSGPGILDALTGLFEPDSALAGINLISFTAGSCTGTVGITVLPISTDNITAACPDSESFQLNAQPPGGYWEGPHTTTEGSFGPTTEGIFEVTYHTSECTDTLTVYVANIDGISPLDSICQSVHRDTINFYPPGGYWSGPGIADSLLGIYFPEDMPAGWVSLLYTINGCSEVFDVYIKEIQIGPSFTSTCPEQDPMVFYSNPPAPPGGYWQGTGVINTATGLFDPSIIPNNTYTNVIYYAPNGCSDTTVIYNRKTIIALNHLYLCSVDPPYPLIRDSIGHSPHYGGQWAGPGVLNPFGDAWLFHPGLAGVGTHQLSYLKNECMDSLLVTVYPSQLGIAPQGFCSTADPVIFGGGLPVGGSWSGPGITNSATGAFNPALAPPGIHLLQWSNPAGCSDNIQVEVETFLQSSITGLGPVYCHFSASVNVVIEPPGAIIAGPVNSGIFIPSLAGEGTHPIHVEWTGTYCSSEAETTVQVLPPLNIILTSSSQTVCGGAAAFLTSEASGGNPDLSYVYAWSDDSFPISTNTALPSTSEWITVTVSDGCSDPVSDSVFVTVLPPVQFEVSTSDLQCFGEDGFAAVEVTSDGNFQTAWNGVVSPSIFAAAGSAHLLQITDEIYGCSRDTLVLIPNYPPVIAAFSINPNEPCISFDDRDQVTIIDLSVNASTGSWDLGNGTSMPYTSGVNPQPVYPDAGQYTIILEVENEGGCPSSASATLCVLPASPVFIPDIFSPNGDGNNDILYVRSHGISVMQFEIYNRWGERVFESSDTRKGWDGQHRGQPSPSGSYFFILRASLQDGTTTEMKGEIALVR